MTQEDKQLLFKDLCARIPYHVWVKVWIEDGTTEEGQLDLEHNYSNVLEDAFYNNVITNIKPYLRPMSSMTEEEEVLFRCELPAIAKTDAQLVAMRMELFLKGHLDFNHLIEKGLALEAPEDMYN